MGCSLPDEGGRFGCSGGKIPVEELLQTLLQGNMSGKRKVQTGFESVGICG